MCRCFSTLNVVVHEHGAFRLWSMVGGWGVQRSTYKCDEGTITFPYGGWLNWKRLISRVARHKIRQQIHQASKATGRATSSHRKLTITSWGLQEIPFACSAAKRQTYGSDRWKGFSCGGAQTMELPPTGDEVTRANSVLVPAANHFCLAFPSWLWCTSDVSTCCFRSALGMIDLLLFGWFYSCF